MKLHQINTSEENILSEGLLHVLGQILKYTAIFLGGAFLLRTAYRIITDEKKKSDDNELQYYMVMGDVLQIQRGMEGRLEDLLQMFAAEFKVMTNALSYSYDHKIVSGKKYDVDESNGKFFNVNIILFYRSPTDVSQGTRYIDKINDKFETKFELIKKGKV